MPPKSIHESEEVRSDETISKISYFQLFRYATRFDKCLIGFALISSILGGVAVSSTSTVLNSTFIAIIIRADPDQYYDYDDTESGPETSPTPSTTTAAPNNEEFMAKLKVSVMALCKIAFLVLFFSFLATTAMKIASYNQVFRIRKIYLKAALNQDLSYYDERRDDLASKMGDIVTSLEEGINDRVTNVVFSIAITVYTIITAFLTSWMVTAFSCVIFAVMVALMTASVIVARRWYIREDEVMDRAGCLAEEVLSAIRTVHAFGGKQKEIHRYGRYLQRAKSIFIKREIYVGIFLGLGSFLMHLNLALVDFFAILIQMILNDPNIMTWYHNGLAVTLMFQAGLTIRGIATVVKTVGSALGAGSEIFKIVDNVPKINPQLDVGDKLKNFEGNIELRNVEFQYPCRPDTPVLRGINISLKKGQLVGLVGQSGCGKSTIFHLLSRFYDVTNGSVCFDGKDIRELSVQWLRAQVGLVTSEPVLFNCTVRENIHYGREGASDEQVKAAARQANAHYFIMKLPKGYDTVVGDRGASLSCGQKQRVAIARALLRDPRLLLLDEGTSALDTHSEAKFQDALVKISVNRTTLIAANHLSMIRNVDMIYVLKQGRIVEYGNHSDLMDKKGSYYRMAKLQGMGISVVNRSKSQMQIMDDESAVEKRSDISELSEDTVKSTALESDSSHISRWHVLALALPNWKYLALGTLSSGVKNLGFPILSTLAIAQNVFTIDFGEFDYMLRESANFFGKLSAFGCLIGLAAFMQEYMFGKVGALLTHRLRSRMYGHLLTQDLSFFDRRNNSTGSLCARMSGLTASIRRASGQSTSYLVEGIMAMLFMMCITIIYESRIAIFLLLFLPLLVIFLYFQGLITNNESLGIHQAIEESMKVSVEAVTNITLVASLGCENLLLRKHRAMNNHARSLARWSALWTGLLTGTSRALTILLLAAVIFYSGELMVKSTINYKSIILILYTMYMLESHYINALLCSTEVMQGLGAARRILRSLHEKPLIQDPDEPGSVHFKATGQISLKNVVMSYPSQPSTQVLKGLSFDIETGKTYALAGANGSGKSTVIKLLLRFYDPVSGEVTFDGIPLPMLRLADFRQSIGVVFEDSILFERTIAENIAYGDNTRDMPEADIIEAAMQADIHGFVLTLPNGYQTKIGSKGTLLSTGQKQKVALARALVRKPTILLLDDATSMLDAESEKEVQDALDKAKEGRTVLTVTRTASSLRAADLVFVLHDGRLAERGTHDSLMADHGLYYTLHKYL